MSCSPTPLPGSVTSGVAAASTSSVWMPPDIVFHVSVSAHAWSIRCRLAPCRLSLVMLTVKVAEVIVAPSGMTPPSETKRFPNRSRTCRTLGSKSTTSVVVAELS